LNIKYAILASIFAVAVTTHQGIAVAASPWRQLLPGEDLSAWRGWQADGIPAGWHLKDGTLTKEGEVDDIVTHDEFGNFELELEWKIGAGGNSGIFYRGTREYDHIYWSGPEYQLLDDARARDGKNPLTSAASAYALYGPPRGVVKPAGEWNKTRIVVAGSHVDHWLNGQKVVEYELGSDDWKARVAASKFREYPHYGLAQQGYIGIQGDHDGLLAIRHVRIRELP
jgi:hypothetical protein